MHNQHAIHAGSMHACTRAGRVTAKLAKLVDTLHVHKQLYRTNPHVLQYVCECLPQEELLVMFD
jgi:hypothetical protein